LRTSQDISLKYKKDMKKIESFRGSAVYKIRNIGDKDGPFVPYNGYTIDQIMDLVNQITENIKNNSK